MVKWVYSFGNGIVEGVVDMCNLLGGKGVNFVEMSSFGFFVLLGFIIIIEVCIWYYDYEWVYFDIFKV